MSRELLAETETGRIEVCACGAWRFSLGDVTFGLAADEASELFVLLGQAVTGNFARAELQVQRRSLAFGITRGDA